MKRTKIIATIGPASVSKHMIRALIEAGTNAFRLNFSHGTHEEHALSIVRIRKAASELRRSISIIADMQGPKIRTGKLKEKKVQLRRGQSIILTTKKIIGDEKRIHVDYNKLPEVVRKNMIILLSEGMIKLQVVSKSKNTITCRVLQGGMLGERKGVNIINIELATAFTPKDQKDLVFALQHKVDYVALSFIRTAHDIIRVKKFIERRKQYVPIIAKIEKPEAVQNLQSIMKEVDGIMVARGDLGVEGKLEAVPVWQKQIIHESNKHGKIVITATQLLESMIVASKPTRAEVTDVANAIFDGTCAVMLSGETAVGAYPVNVVRTMRRIIRYAEKSRIIRYYHDHLIKGEQSSTFSIAHAAIDAARDARVKGIFVFTISGFSASFIANRRPDVPIFAFTPKKEVYNRLSLMWGVYPLMISLSSDIDVVIKQAEQFIVKKKLLKKGDEVVVVYGSAEVAGGTDRMKLMHIG